VIRLFIKIIPDKFLKKQDGNFVKIKYLKSLTTLKKAIKSFNPDIIHAHYATSYGLLGTLSKFHPYIISVWGSDIYDFPHRSFIHKKIVEFNLFRADKILSTSKVMAKETQKYTGKDVEVTPFGIDLQFFKPAKVQNLFEEKNIIIGTVKTLEEKYGIEYLIRAFKILKDKRLDLPIKLLIVGGGSQELYLKDLTKELGIEKDTIFTGRVPYTDVPKYQNMLSVSVSVSDSESFGVAVVEASACEKPVVVSNVGGLPEVVVDGITGFIVEPRNPAQTADAIERLILDDQLRIKMGKAGRERVQLLFNWNDNVDQMVRIYRNVLEE
jgi:glycosyltransferase involved in cell wall biosynthesis